MNEVKKDNKPDKIHIILLILATIVFILSAIKPKSYLIWLLEAYPVFIGVIILIFTYKKFQFTNFVYILIFILISIMLIGAHYTYGDVPLFNWIKEIYGLRRNHYDRVGHFVQGLIPAFIVREILIRKLKLKKGIILGILVICICLSLSAFYELMEWGISSLSGASFLGLQGDKWDAQWDMLWALTGAILTVSMFYKVHDKYISKQEKGL
jgi:putative membrane protein